MPCNICGKRFNPEQVGAGYSIGFHVSAKCPCAQIRSRERAKGCPKCKTKADHQNPVLNLEIVKSWGREYYLMTCDICGHQWKVKE
jgi:hypothetical protein